MAKKKDDNVITNNKKAKFNYFLKEFYEAGISLVGTEIKALRESGCSIDQAYILFKNNEAYIAFMNIPVYKQGNIFNHEPTRMRKLLLHKQEIKYLANYIKLHPHYYVVPTKIYIKNGLAKVQIALSESKRVSDKRDTIKNREAERQASRASKLKY